MEKSAKLTKREATAWAIAAAASALADEHGLDGFTMEQLAETAGVSRRTLFNYYPSKIDAVLGTPPDHDPALIETFHAGGPTGHLVTDLKELAVGILASRELEYEELARYRRLLRNEPRIMHATQARFEATTDLFVVEILNREGDRVTPQSARIAVRLILAVFDLALDAFLADPGKATLAEQFSRTVDTVKELLG